MGKAALLAVMLVAVILAVWHRADQDLEKALDRILDLVGRLAASQAA